MNRGCWKVDDNDEAVYIDVEEDENVANDKEYSQWSTLPDLLLERIFAQLTIRQRYYASLVCRSWFRAFKLPGVWSHFILDDTTLTRGKFNYYSGWQYVLDHLRTSVCLTRIGRNIRELTFEPMLNFYNLYEFMNMVSWFTEQGTYDTPAAMQFKGIGTHMRALKFTFPCDMESRDETERIRLFGTGGKLLEALKRLMSNLGDLRRLELVNLFLNHVEAQHLLDNVCHERCLTLRILVVINTTKIYCPLLHLGLFLNLHTLIVSPQNINDDVIELLGYTKLRKLHLIQNRFTPSDCALVAVSSKVWKQCHINNPRLHVYLEVESVREKLLLWQPGAPVYSLIYESPHIKLKPEDLLTAVDLYKNTLRHYGHKTIPRFHEPKPFHERVDSLLLLMCRQVPYLRTLIIREKISTATVLLLAFTGKQLQHLHIRRNAVILRSDWTKSPEWSSEFFAWIECNSRSYDLVEKEVSQILGYKWKLLTDKEFKNINVYVHSTGY